MFVTITGGKLILWVAAVKESKGISLALAEFVRRLRIRISCFLLISAARPTCGFCRSVKGGLW